MLLAGDIGGTKSRLAVFADGGGRTPLHEELLPSARFNGAEALIREFLDSRGLFVDRAALAVAGPVADGRAPVTNLPWVVDARKIGQSFGFKSVVLMNDLAATARAVPLLEPTQLLTLSPGERAACGGIAVIAPGTGLGEAFLTRDGKGYQEHASEGGHADFAPADELEADLLQRLRGEGAHASYERLCSGPGLGRIYAFFRDRAPGAEPADLAARLAAGADPAPIIVETALANRQSLCGAAVERFVSILGAEAGNLALKVLATGGVYLGGGIAPRILPFLEQGPFLSSFRAKGRMTDLLSRIPVHVILEPRAALIGAADRGLRES